MRLGQKCARVNDMFIIPLESRLLFESWLNVPVNNISII